MENHNKATHCAHTTSRSYIAIFIVLLSCASEILVVAFFSPKGEYDYWFRAIALTCVVNGAFAVSIVVSIAILLWEESKRIGVLYIAISLGVFIGINIYLNAKGIGPVWHILF
jgi:hypothetical protein